MKKIALILMSITILSKVFGFARDIMLSYFYGASNISDAYLISITIPMVLFSFIGTGISTGYIPMYSSIERNNGEAEANKFTNNLINILLALCSIIVILGLLYTEPIVKIFASGFKGETLILAVQFTRIALLGTYFSGLIYIYSGYLQLKGNYFIPALIGFPFNFVIILSIIISSKTSIFVLSIGSVAAIAAQLLLMIPFIYKKGYRHKPVFDIHDKNIKNMTYIALPVIIGMSANQVNLLVDRTIASMVAVGGISALNYANRLNGFVQGIFVLSITTVMYPMISKMAAENNISGLIKSLKEAIGSINILVVPATIGSILFAKPIVRLLFGRGAFDEQAISVTAYALLFYSIGMIGYGLREVLSRAFYSLQDTKTPMYNAAIAVILNIILNIILSRYMGIGGLALATSISAIFCTILLFINLRKKIGPFGVKSISISFIKVLCASLVMGFVAKFTYNYLTSIMNPNIALLIAIGTGSIVYFATIYFMKIDDVDNVINAIKRKLGRNVTG